MPYEVGHRVIARLPTEWRMKDLKGRTEALGTVVEKPGGAVYNVLLDEPLEGEGNHTSHTLTYLSEYDLRPANS